MDIIILRHAETDAEKENRTLGWVDKALNTNGVIAVQQYAHFLKQQQENVDLIITSPLTRARQTALIISEALNIPFIENELIKERDFGELSGLTWEEFETKYPDLAIKNKPSFQEYLPKGESIEQVAERVAKFVHFLRQLKMGNKYRKIVIVTHTGIIRIILRNLLGYTPEQTRELDIANLSRFELEI
jgi:broad specificity phosphatase PhoE